MGERGKECVCEFVWVCIWEIPPSVFLFFLLSTLCHKTTMPTFPYTCALTTLTCWLLQVGQRWREKSCSTWTFHLLLYENRNASNTSYTWLRYSSMAIWVPCVSHVFKSHATHRALITCNMPCCMPHSTKGQLSYWVWQSWNHIYFQFYFTDWTINRWKRGRTQSTWRKPLGP